MGLNFPDAPVLDDTFSDPVTGKAYTFDGEKWWGSKAGASLPPPDNVYLPLAGGTMTGAIQLRAAQPVAQTESTHKQYVDTAIAAKSLYQGVWQVAANTPDLTPGVIPALHSYSWIANTVDPNSPETAPAALPGIGGTLISSSDTVIWNATTALYEHVRSPASVSGDFVEVTGDTMTGNLLLPAAMPTLPEQAAHKAYVDSVATTGDFLPLTGGTLSGDLIASAGIGMGSAVAASATDLTRHLALYAATFGLNVTGGTLNYVVPASNKHDFHVGTVLRASFAAGVTLNGLATINGQIVVSGGIRVTNHQAVAIEGNGTLAVGGATTLTGALNANSGINIGANQDVYYAAGVNTGYSAANGHYYNTSNFHTFWVSGTQRFGIDGTGVTVYGTITDALVADAVKKDPSLPGKNIGALLLHALAEIKTLKAEVAALKARK